MLFTSSGCTSATDDVGSTKADDMIDLTQMQYTMVYPAICNLYQDMSCRGKTLRMRGSVSSYTEEGVTHHACVVTDNTQCCSIGLEYFLSEGEYPAEDYTGEITVEGVLDLVIQNGYGSLVLKEAKLLK